MPTIDSELAEQREVHGRTDRRVRLVFEDPMCVMSILDGEEHILTKRFTADETVAMMKAAEYYPPLLETLHRIKSLCQHSNTPAVNVGAHELAGKILALIQQWEER